MAQAESYLLQARLARGSPMDRHHCSRGWLVILFAATAFHNTGKWVKKKFLFVDMLVLKPKTCSTCKSHAPLWKVTLSLYCGPIHWLFAARNIHPYLGVVTAHLCLTGINLFSSSISASARLWHLPLSPTQHSVSGWSPSLLHSYRDSPPKHPGPLMPSQSGGPTSLTLYNL